MRRRKENGNRRDLGSPALLPHFYVLVEACILSDPLHARNDFLPMSLEGEGI
jgi:hypothetical protein